MTGRGRSMWQADINPMPKRKGSWRYKIDANGPGYDGPATIERVQDVIDDLTYRLDNALEVMADIKENGERWPRVKRADATVRR